MEAEQVICMNGGVGKTSYATNSSHTRRVISMVKPILKETIEELYRSKLPDCFVMADLGCSSGPNTLLVVAQILDIIGSASQKLNLKNPPCLQAFLNDLPGNDFNTLFLSVGKFYKQVKDDINGRKIGGCFIGGVPGSFFSRLFPANSLHFFHSCYAIMWTSEVPKVFNKGNIYISKTSSPAVMKAYLDQYYRDFTIFLKWRAEELVSGGRMLLTTMGSTKDDNGLFTGECDFWELIGLKLHDMVLEGIIEEEKLDSFNIPSYTPTREEIKRAVEAEGSFKLERIEVFEMEWDACIGKNNPSLSKKERAAAVSGEIRSVAEPVLSSHFGGEIMADLFHRFEESVLDHMQKNNGKLINIVSCLTKKD